MTVFLDASALVAIMRDEPEAFFLGDVIGADQVRITNGIALWETARAIARLAKDSLDAAWLEVERYCSELSILVVPIDLFEARGAIEAQQRYGKGSGHGAGLNMGDCFAYACAKTNDARLLYKGNDFAQTDFA